MKAGHFRQDLWWPGNVRELESVIERAVVSSAGPVLRLADLGLKTVADAAAPAVAPLPLAGPPVEPAGTAPEAGTLSGHERKLIVSTLEQTFWRVEGTDGAAARLGMNPSTLRSRMRKHGIRRPGSRRSRPRQEARRLAVESGVE